MKLSVIMLTYNREKLVGRMISCILSQTFTDFEFIIIDNGSTDGSGNIAEAYGKKDKRIRVLHRPQGNIGSGRNAGLDLARGDYVAFVDDDDTCTPDYLSFLYQLATGSGADISICGATWANHDDRFIMTPEEALLLLLHRKRYNVAFPTKMFRRGMFERHRFLASGKFDDIYLMPKMLADAARVAYHGISKYHFERHGRNNSAWTQNHRLITADILREYLDVYAERTRWLSQKFPGNTENWNYFNWSFMLSMVEKVARLRLSDCTAIQAELIAELKTNRREMMQSKNLTDFEREWMQTYVAEGGNGDR